MRRSPLGMRRVIHGVDRMAYPDAAVVPCVDLYGGTVCPRARPQEMGRMGSNGVGSPFPSTGEGMVLTPRRSVLGSVP